MNIIAKEPVAIGALIAIGINLAISFGLNLTIEQVAMVNALVVGVLALIARNVVTPTAAPSLVQGTTVEVITPGKEPNYSVPLA